MFSVLLIIIFKFTTPCVWWSTSRGIDFDYDIYLLYSNSLFSLILYVGIYELYVFIAQDMMDPGLQVAWYNE